MNSHEYDLLYKDLCLFSENGTGKISDLGKRVEKLATWLTTLGDDGCGNTQKAIEAVVQLVQTYFQCLPCSKVTKLIGKVLSSLPACLQHTVELELKTNIIHLITKESSFEKVSSLLEQCTFGHHLIQTELPVLCGQLQEHIQRWRTAESAVLSRRDTAQLLLAVKVTLQVVQYFREDVSEVIGSSVECPLRSPFSSLVQELVNLLRLNDNEADLYLFGGTLLAMVLNLIPDPQAAVCAFWQIREVLLQKSKSCQIGNLSFIFKDEKICEVTNISELTFVRGVTVCAKENIQLAVSNDEKDVLKEGRELKISSNKGDNPFFLDLFPLIFCYCEKLTTQTHHYYAFQVLSLWFKALLKNLPLKSNFTSKNSPILTQTLKQVFLNWDSPVDGVSEYVGEVFQSLLEIWSRERTEGRTDNDKLVEELLQHLLDIPWNVKGKYRLIGLLLPHTEISEVLELSPLKGHLLKCMGTNNLAPLASDVYKICLLQTRHVSEEKRLDLWKRSWLECLLHGLSSSNQLLCKKLSDYWIPLTLKLLPGSSIFLPTHLGHLLHEGRQLCRQRGRVLYVWLLVLRIIRSSRSLEEGQLDITLLEEGLYSGDDDTRGEVVALLCGTVKKSELLTERESTLLKSCVPLCLRVDAAPFRQHLAANMKKLLIRLRDGCLAVIKKNQKELTTLSIEFLDWLHRRLVESLFPGGSFQRRKTCLDLLSLLYETLVYVPGGGIGQRGRAEERSRQVLALAHSRGQCEFFSQETAMMLLSCVMDGADEVQDLSCQLLIRFYPWTTLSVVQPSTSRPSAGHSSSVHPIHQLATHLLNTAFKLCSSPRPYEARSGALLCNIVHLKFACEQGVVLTRQAEVLQAVILTETDQSNIKFLELLLLEMENSVTLATEDPVTASRDSPLHGLIQAATLCLKSRTLTGNIDRLLLQFVKVNVRVIQMMMSVMAGGKDIENCPSFAEVGVALESLVSEGEEESLGLTPEYQILLSWCWVNLKESCTCLGELTSALVKSKSDHSTWLPDLKNIGQIFILVLTNCRVRGAIEGCRNGLLNYSTVLLASEHKSLSEISAELLHQIVWSLESNEMAASVTRRSAGLPIVVQIIAQAEQRLKQQGLLLKTVETLLHLSSLPYQPESDQRQDLVQVHALNILRAVFGDASLVPALMPSYTRMLLIVFDGFESPSWAIRNAATQLFGTMMSRMFGPRSKGGTGHNIMTFQELSAHYPGLPAAMLEKLTNGARDVHSISSLSPSVFLVLTVLASLGPAESDIDLHQHHSSFMEKITDCLEASVYTLRELSALAYVAFVPANVTKERIFELVKRLPSSHSDSFKHNSLHGALLCIEKLVLRSQFSEEVKKRILSVFLVKSWLVTDMEHCPLMGAKYIQIVRHLMEDTHCTSEEMDDVMLLLKSYDAKEPSRILEVGTGLMVTDSVSCVTNLLRGDPATLTQRMTSWLQNGDPDVCSACLDQLVVMVDGSNSLDWVVVQKSLWRLLLQSTINTQRTTALQLLCDIRLNHNVRTIDRFSLLDLHRTRTQTEPCSSLHAACVPVEAMFVENILHGVTELTQDIVETVYSWCERVKTVSDALQTDTARTAAARGLSVAGEITLTTFSQKASFSQSEDILTVLIESVLNLLEDGDSDIRKMAASFVASLQWPKRQIQFTDINITTCQKMFSEYIAHTLSWSQTVAEFLIRKLYSPGEATAACRHNRINTKVEVLFEQEASSVLAEAPLQRLLIHSTLKTLLSNYQVEMKTFISELVEEVSQDLMSCIKLLEVDLKDISAPDNPLVNISSDASVLSSLTGLILIADVAISMSAGEDVTQRLKSGLMALIQMPNLNPWLKNKFHDLP